MIDAFHRRLSERLSELVEKRHELLVSAAASQNIEAIALQSVRHATYARALKHVLDIAKDIETELYGDQSKRVLGN